LSPALKWNVIQIAALTPTLDLNVTSYRTEPDSSLQCDSFCRAEPDIGLERIFLSGEPDFAVEGDLRMVA